VLPPPGGGACGLQLSSVKPGHNPCARRQVERFGAVSSPTRAKGESVVLAETPELRAAGLACLGALIRERADPSGLGASGGSGSVRTSGNVRTSGEGGGGGGAGVSAGLFVAARITAALAATPSLESGIAARLNFLR